MKSFVWFTTLLLLCIELAHAAHIAPIKGHRQHRRASTKPTSRALKRRANRTCSPPASSNGTTPGQINAANGNGFPSLGFKMPDSVPSSVDGWWTDYKAEIGFLGFSYSVSGCTSPHVFLLSLICNFDPCSPLRFPGQSAGTLKSEFKDIRNRFNGRYVRLYGACDRNGF